MSEEQFALLEEILSKQNFREWAVGEAPEMDDFWKKWSAEDPDRKKVLSYAREVTASFHQTMPDIGEEYVLQKIQQVVLAERGRGPFFGFFSKKRKWNSLILRGAASALVAAGLGWAAYLHVGTKENDYKESAVYDRASTATSFVTVKNTERSARHILLSDGSSVVLQPGGEISFPRTFGPSTREVRLDGEAFFEVVKNPAAPFYVLANQTVTKVVGTSFRIKSRPETPFLEINVKSGTVAVFTDKIQQGLDLNDYPDERTTLLRKNEKAVFEVVENELRKQPETVDLPQVSLPIEKLSFVYESTPLQTVFSELEAAYGIRIVYDELQFAGCSLTAELGDEPLHKKISWICAILEADYHLKDNEITIYGKPCQ